MQKAATPWNETPAIGKSILQDRPGRTSFRAGEVAMPEDDKVPPRRRRSWPVIFAMARPATQRLHIQSGSPNRRMPERLLSTFSTEGERSSE